MSVQYISLQAVKMVLILFAMRKDDDLALFPPAALSTDSTSKTKTGAHVSKQTQALLSEVKALHQGNAR